MDFGDDDTADPVLTVLHPALPGLYRLDVKRRGGDFRPWTSGDFSVSIDEDESDLRQIDVATFRDGFPSLPGRGLLDGSQPLWPYLLWAGLLALVAETLLLRLWWTR